MHLALLLWLKLSLILAPERIQRLLYKTIRMGCLPYNTTFYLRLRLWRTAIIWVTFMTSVYVCSDCRIPSK